MARSVNRITLIGNLGRDPELRSLPGGGSVAGTSLATNRLVGDGRKERTDWHRLAFWGRLALFAEEHLRRGDRIYVEGRVEYDVYEREGVSIPTIEVRVREVVLLSPPRMGEVEERTVGIAEVDLEEDEIEEE